MRRQLARRFLLRGHMSLILAVLVRADPAARKLLLVPRFASLPAWRLLAVAAAYLV